MGDAADQLTEQGIDERAIHMAGECDGMCPYCREDLATLKRQRKQTGKAGRSGDDIRGTFDRSDREHVRGSLSVFKNTEYFSLRVWYKDDDGTVKPSKNGINLRMEEKIDFLKLIIKVFGFDLVNDVLLESHETED